MAAVMNADAVDAASLHGKLLLIDAEQASARIVAGLLAQHGGVSLVHATDGLAGVALFPARSVMLGALRETATNPLAVGLRLKV